MRSKQQFESMHWPRAAAVGESDGAIFAVPAQGAYPSVGTNYAPPVEVTVSNRPGNPAASATK